MSIKLNNNLYLNKISFTNVVEVAPPTAVNHIVVIDCSGSMSGELPLIREQLKSKLPSLLGEKDTVSIIWFSGRGQFGVLIEGEPVATLADLSQVNKAIDRWLKPVGLTGFVEPLHEIGKVKDRVAAKTGNDVFAVFFMSDGCDNQWRDHDIIGAANSVSAASVTIVEYGYYADRERLARIAESSGGTHIFARDFNSYAPIFNGAITKNVSSVLCRPVRIPSTVVGGFVYAVDGDTLRTFAVTNGLAVIPENIQSIYYLSPSDDTDTKIAETAPMYAALSLFSTRMMPDIIYPILRVLGDVKFIKQFSGCFGKDKYTAFHEDTKAAVFNPGLRLVDGFDRNAVPRDDAFTVIELMELLTERDRVMLDHPAFKYNRISRQRESTAGKVKQEEIDAVAASLESADLDKVGAAIERLTALKVKAEEPELKFISDPADDGYSISGLVIAEDRANISFRVRKTGAVDLGVLPISSKSVPSLFPTYVWRNYAVVKDGMVNVEVLPLRLSVESAEKISQAIVNGRLDESAVEIDSNGTILFDLNKIPVVNRNMVKAPSAKAMFETEWELLQLQAAKKVFDHYRKELFPKESKGFIEMYGKDAADWLKEKGLTDYGGFNPKGDQAESTDFYLAKELKVSIKGFSSLPSINDVKKRMADGKLTPPAALMAPHIEWAEAEIKDRGSVAEEWLVNQIEMQVRYVRECQLRLAKIKFAVLVGQVWFTEFSSLEDCKLDVKISDSRTITGTVEQRLVEVKI